MTESAFGVDHGEEISKKAGKKPSTERKVAAGVFGGYHSAVAGKSGKKLRATARTVAHETVGGLAGGVGGSVIAGPRLGVPAAFTGAVAGSQTALKENNRRGYYKKEKVNKSAFDVDHEVSKAMNFRMPGAFRGAANTARKIKPTVPGFSASRNTAQAGGAHRAPGGTLRGMAQNAKPFAQQNKKPLGLAAGGLGTGAAGGSMFANRNKQQR